MLKFSRQNAKTANLASVPALQKYLANGHKIYSLDLPAGKSCPGAKDCHSWVNIDSLGKATIKDGPHTQFRCFSASQEAQYPAVRALREHNKAEIDACGKSAAKIARLITSSLPHNVGIVRLHVSGDVYSLAYMSAIVGVAAANPHILFYFYTKSLNYLQRVVASVPSANLSIGVILPNLMVTASVGGKYDSLIPTLGVRTASVVYSEAEATQKGYVIDHTDEHASLSGGSFALLIHGTMPAGTEAGKAVAKLRKLGLGSYSRK
jgi:hypothetical protein